MTAPPVIGGTTSQDRTDSTNELTKMIRAALLGFQHPESGLSARDTIVERLYVGRAPAGADVKWPYAVMRLDQRNLGRAHGIRRECTLEVTVFGKPWSQQELVNDVCDLFDQAMLNLVKTTQGLTFCRDSTRQPLPAGVAPVDGEVVTVLLSYTLIVWPAFLYNVTHF